MERVGEYKRKESAHFSERQPSMVNCVFFQCSPARTRATKVNEVFFGIGGERGERSGRVL